jgi:hypothetical protein
MVVDMRASGDRFDGPSGIGLNRRQLLGAAGAMGLVTALGACSKPQEVASSATSGNFSTPSAPGTTAAPAATLGPTSQTAEPAPPPLAVAAPMICRDAWGAQPALPGGIPHTLTRMTLHHTAVTLGDNRHAPARLRQHQQLHQNERGWIDIAYHVGVDRNGNIYELRDPLLKGDTATEYDTTGHFLVLCEGNFDEETVTPEQLHSAAMAFAWAASTFSISPSVVEGHKDYAGTACPGAGLYSYVASGELTRRVTDLLTAGPVNLQRICGPEAVERVAAIEAGG